MKKLMAMTMVAVMAISLCACGGSAKSGEPVKEGSAEAETSTESQNFKVGICNYVDHASLNQIVDNVQSRLEELGSENQVTFDVSYDNCNADANVMDQIIANFIADDVDLMVGVATPVAMAMQSATEDNEIPVVFAAVSDPEGVELVSSNDAPGANVTGTSDYLDAKSVMQLIFEANPDVSKVGLLYDVGQDSSTAPIAQAKAYLEEKGVEYVERTGTTADEVALAADALVADGVDAVFTPTDNTIMNSEMAIYETFMDAKIPHYTGADSFALNGAFLGYGVDYAHLGKETADMVYDILKGGKTPSTMPVRTFDNGTATINTDVCEAIGMDFEELKSAFEPFCTEIKAIKTDDSFEEEQ